MPFSAEDVGIADAVAHAELRDLAAGLRMRVATPTDLIVRTLAAAAEPRRRASRGKPLNLEQVTACPVAVAGSLFGSDKA